MNENQATPLNAVGNMKHSPLPWHISTNGATRESGGEPAFPGVHDASGKPHGEDIVCQCLGFSEECRANAELIVASVNRLPAIVAAVEKALAALDDIGRYQGEGGPGTPWRDIVRECGAAARAAADDLRAIHSETKGNTP